MHNDIPPAIGDKIRQIVEATMAPIRIEKLLIVPGRDFDGDDVIFVDVWFEQGQSPIPTQSLRRIQHDVVDLVFAAGDNRFAHVRPHFAVGQTLALAT